MSTEVSPEQVEKSVQAIFDYLEDWPGTLVNAASPYQATWSGDELYPDPFRVAFSYIRVYLMASRHQMLGVSHLLLGQALLGEDVLARACVEAAANAAHLANAWGNPEIFVRESTVERIWSLVERQKLFARTSDPIESPSENEAEGVRQKEWSWCEEQTLKATEYGFDRGFWQSKSRRCDCKKTPNCDCKDPAQRRTNEVTLKDCLRGIPGRRNMTGR